jgi:aromatic ring-opening dioxygenase catalytic subunit (LigB family)
MKYPAVFVNHGGGPLPLMGRQPNLVKNMKEIVSKFLPKDNPPSAIVVLSAHWESDPISITSGLNPSLYFDYSGFPQETYAYDYPVRGNPALARKIHDLLREHGLPSRLDDQRGFDHGVFVPLMIMFPDATIPVVEVSLHKSLDATINMEIGKALEALRDDNILLLGSGYTFHNMHSIFYPSQQSIKGSQDFNNWLKDTILFPNKNHLEQQNCSAGDEVSSDSDYQQRIHLLGQWEIAPGARISHPREEHLLPLLIVAAAGGKTGTPRLIYDTTLTSVDRDAGSEHAITGYIFE